MLTDVLLIQKYKPAIGFKAKDRPGKGDDLRLFHFNNAKIPCGQFHDLSSFSIIWKKAAMQRMHGRFLLIPDP